MADVSWIKITTGMFEDDKLDFIEGLPEADAIMVIWCKLLCLAGRCNLNGFIMLTENIPFDEKMLANKFKRNISIVSLALDTFIKLNMLSVTENGFCISNFTKHQNIEGMDKIREQTKKRVDKHRELMKLMTASKKDIDDTDESVTENQDCVTKTETQSNVTCNVTVTQSNATDLELELDLDLDKKKKVQEIKTLYADVVLMTDDEHRKLTERFGIDGINSRIEKLSLYIQSTGKKYKSHYATILSWELKNNNSQSGTKGQPVSNNIFGEMLKKEGVT